MKTRKEDIKDKKYIFKKIFPGKMTNSAILALFVALALSFIMSISSVSALVLENGSLNISNNLIVDTNTLFVNSVSNNVGIGTSTPSAKLDVAGNVTLTDGSIWAEGSPAPAATIGNLMGGGMLDTWGNIFRGFRLQQLYDNNGKIDVYLTYNAELKESDLTFPPTFKSDYTAPVAIRMGDDANGIVGFGVLTTTQTDYTFNTWTPNMTETLTVVSNKVGVNNTNPQAAFDVRGDAKFNTNQGNNDFRIDSQSVQNMFYVDADKNNIGIGAHPVNIASLSAWNGKLAIIGATDGAKQGASLFFYSKGSVANEKYGVKWTKDIVGEGAGHITAAIEGVNTNNGYMSTAMDLAFSTATVATSNATERMRITNNGNVGIGTATPKSALQVNGYMQMDVKSDAPPAEDCDNDDEKGRMTLDDSGNQLWICNGASRGWDSVPLND